MAVVNSLTATTGDELVCMLQDLNSGEILVFDFEKPTGYTDNYSTNYQQQDVRGRSSPFQSFVNSGPRTISFSILLSLDYNRGLAASTEDVRNMMKPYGESIAIKPPLLRVKVGKALDIKAIPVSFNAEWGEGYKNGTYRICTWSFAFTEVEDLPSKNIIGSRNNLISVESLVPGPNGSNLTVSTNSRGWTGGVGDSVTIKNSLGYNTAEEALMNRAVDGHPQRVVGGDYKVINSKSNSVEIQMEGSSQTVWVRVQ